MIIIRLDIENYKRIKALSISPDKPSVVIGGENEAGKSSTLDAIQTALGGKKYAPSEPVRRGADKATIVVETATLVVTRVFTAKGRTTLEVQSKDGASYRSPQHMLDELLSGLSFDPLDFSRQDSKQQCVTLQQLMGFDFTESDAERKKVFDERTDVNREVKKLSAQLGVMELTEGLPEKEHVIADLVKELERRRQLNQANKAKWTDLQDMREQAKKKKEILKNLTLELENLKTMGQKLKDEVAAMKDEDVPAAEKALEHAEDINRLIRKNVEIRKLTGEQKDLLGQALMASGRIAEIDEAKQTALATADYPIKGLELTDEGLRLDDLPFEQASQAQKLRTSVAIGLALNPKLKVLLVRDGSLLDSKNLVMVTEMAAAAEAQVWIERVGDDKHCTVVIEDGALKEG